MENHFGELSFGTMEIYLHACKRVMCKWCRFFFFPAFLFICGKSKVRFCRRRSLTCGLRGLFHCFFTALNTAHPRGNLLCIEIVSAITPVRATLLTSGHH